MKKHPIKEKIFYFKRWSRKKYAAFSSLKKLVVIATMSLGCSFLAKPTDSIAQSTPDSNAMLLDAVTITAEETPPETDGLSKILLQFSVQKQEIERTPALSVDQLLEHLPGIDIRQRGPFGTQADISYRGGNFDQTMLLLNGVNFTDPQTGHYSLNLPVSPDIIHRIELFNNTTSFLFGTSPFSGLLNIVTKPENQNSLAMTFSGGMYGYLNGGVALNLKTGKVNHLLSINHNRSKGYVHNTDFEITHVLYHLVGNFMKGTLEFQTGYVDKNYGANGFYSLRYPDQYESMGTFLASVSWESKGRISWKPTVYYRNNTDCFQLIKDQPKEKNNYHATHVAGVNLLTSLKSKIGKTALSLDFRGEDILSTSLGEIRQTPVHSAHFDIDFTCGRTRMTSGLALSHTYKRKRWESSATALLNYFFDLKDKVYFLPAALVGYHYLQREKEKSLYNAHLYLSVASTIRTPTFTDLYYKTGDIIGNQNLLPEQAITAELGSKFNAVKKGKTAAWLSASLSVFSRHGRDMIDYVKADGDVMWRVINHTAIHFLGVETQVSWRPDQFWRDDFPIRQLSIQYCYLYSNKDSQGYQSRYVLDHLIHNLTVSASHTIWKSFSIDYAVSFRKRKGEYTSYKINENGATATYPTYAMVDLKLNYHHTLGDLFIEVSNLFNQKYFDLGDLEQAGIWIVGGVRCKVKGKG
ncbi:MAG: TonB-dependent receptor [Bacteroidales bacterium]|jgi:iron complex outermembrane receptor protein|nr:TonB-dependent receptor [Bacteroidales bacterium]